MSTTAPWLALACDWHESKMFDGTTPAQKLAWIAMLCFTKSRGRAGSCTLRVAVLCREYAIEPDDVEQMLLRAVAAGAIIRTPEGADDVITFCNWRSYQDPHKRRTAGSTMGANLVKCAPFTKTSTTNHQSPHIPSTNHQPPITVGGDVCSLSSETQAALSRLGVRRSSWASLPADLTADTVLRNWLGIDRKLATNPQGIVVGRLRAGTPPDAKLTARMLAAAIRDVQVIGVNGRDVRMGEAKWNGYGVLVGGELVVANKDIDTAVLT